uniref:(northern house mosquito) hypothetical protein n=1 Tax=Culex pipiens TaxID=7175 RepID=A0A8D8BY74_CULPI
MREAAAAFSPRPIVQTRASKEDTKADYLQGAIIVSGSRNQVKDGCIAIPNVLQLSMSGSSLIFFYTESMVVHDIVRSQHQIPSTIASKERFQRTIKSFVYMYS